MFYGHYIRQEITIGNFTFLVCACSFFFTINYQNGNLNRYTTARLMENIRIGIREFNKR